MTNSTEGHMSHDQVAGNGNGNGNGKGVFRLAPVESPEEEARTVMLRQIAPQIRRKVREDDSLSAGAKFFFFALFDDVYWYQGGGNGIGQVYTDLRTLADRYKHSVASISRWRTELEKAGWLWTHYDWPMTEFRLTPLMPAPFPSAHKRAVQMALGRASKAVLKMSTTPHNGVNKGKNGKMTPGRTQNDVRSYSNCSDSVLKLSGGCTQNEYDPVLKMSTEGDQNEYERDSFCVQPEAIPMTLAHQNEYEPMQSCGEEPHKSSGPLAQSGPGENDSGAIRSLGGSSKRLSKRPSGKGLPKRPDEENFMELSLRVMGSDEMEKNGALWRTILRQDPEGAWKAMQDGWDVRKTPSDFRNVKTTMGAFVMDKYLSVFAAPEFRRRSYDTAAKASRKSSRPADKKPAPAPAQKRSPKSSEQEFEKVNLENARSLVRDGEEDLLSERMVTALVRAGDELPPSVEHRFGKLIESILKKESPVPA